MAQVPSKPLKEHVAHVMALVPAGVKVSFELRARYDKKLDDYVLDVGSYYTESMLLRFSITKAKAS